MPACKKCGNPIVWKKNDGQWQCFNPDGDIHWDLCSELRARQRLAAGLPMQEHSKIIGRIDTTGCNQCVPPWEVCPYGCPIEFDNQCDLSPDQRAHLSDI